MRRSIGQRMAIYFRGYGIIGGVLGGYGIIGGVLGAKPLKV